MLRIIQVQNIILDMFLKVGTGYENNKSKKKSRETLHSHMNHHIPQFHEKDCGFTLKKKVDLDHY